MFERFFAAGQYVLRNSLFACLLLAGSHTTYATAQESGAVPIAVQESVVQPQLAGQGQLRFFGMRIYDARLWVGPQFDVQALDAHPLALELTYHRAFSAQTIAERSVKEIERQRPIDAQQRAAWIAQLAQWMPDVKSGDRLTGVYLPAQGMQLWLGEQLLGTLNDAELARQFIGIWLSPQTSEPGLRSDLLGAQLKDVR